MFARFIQAMEKQWFSPSLRDIEKGHKPRKEENVEYDGHEVLFALEIILNGAKSGLSNEDIVGLLQEEYTPSSNQPKLSNVG